MDFVDRQIELARLRRALSREHSQFIVLYGRRRIGKSTLLKKLLEDSGREFVYYLADTTDEANQRRLFAQMAAATLPDFDRPTYPDWEALLLNFNRAIGKRITLCLDEFPYLVRSCPSLPSVLQKLIDGKALKFDIIICGSSQRMMQGFVLDSREPLYGRADEIVRLEPIAARYLIDYLGCDAAQAVREYAVWGGVPRYWELRRDYASLEQAVDNLLFSTHGVLYDEPTRLLQDEMRDTLQASTILSVVGNGANKLSEIAARVGKKATDVTPLLARLRELDFVDREVPFGEDVKKSRQGLYHVNDALLRFHYRFVQPLRSLIAFGRGEVAEATFRRDENDYVGACWETLCRRYVSGNTIGGVTYNMAGRWWGRCRDELTGKTVEAELDVVAESLDKRHLLIGECKWTRREDAAALVAKLNSISHSLPAARGHEVHIVLFLKNQPLNSRGVKVFYPADVLS